MFNAVSLRSRVLAVLAIGAVSMPLGALPLSAADGSRRMRVDAIQYECTILGPYATIRRANEVANAARIYGYSAVSYHNGDGWYVRVC
jgi:hypothetical protein